MKHWIMLFIPCVSVIREWVLKSGMLIAMSVYTYLRLIVDHGAPNLLPLRQKEVDFCISMLREKVRGESGRVERSIQGGVRCMSPSEVTERSLSAVHGVCDHRQRSGPAAAERRSNSRDGAAVERTASQPPSPQPPVHW